MDKNSVIGIFLIFGVLVLFTIINRPSEEEILEAKRKRDSIALVEKKQERLLQLQEEKSFDQEITNLPDSVDTETLLKQKSDQLGVFGRAAVGEEQFYTVENNLFKITFTNKGGRIYSIELKEYKTYKSLPVILFDGPDTKFGLNFFAQNRSINTDLLFFAPQFSEEKITVNGPEVRKGNEGRVKYNENHPGNSKRIGFRLEVEPGKFLEYIYTIEHNSYLIDLDMKFVELDQYIASNQAYINFTWSFDVPRQERISRFGEDRYTNIVYKFFENDVDNLPQAKSGEKNLSTRIKWIGFKQLFFNSSIISKDFFPNAYVKSERFDNNDEYLANFLSEIAFPYEGKDSESIGLQFYFGPNHYQTLNQFDIELERLVYLGYLIVRPVNKYLIIPVFNFLRKFISNFGIIILLLTIFIKTILFPFTYKSYISQAKMRALKPEMDQINKKYGDDKPMEKQQATMALYKRAGVNPMGGCLPMLLQFPILVAMFFFFPTSIELRQQSFLWVDDLSTYDSILDLPFSIPLYGDHVSLFCLLMTITTIISTRLNQQATSPQGMPGMKMMMYMMPIMFLFILNNYSAGLSYYYFLANLITIGQTYIIRSFVDEKKIRAQLQVNKKKPLKKSKFQKRLEDMAKQRGIQMPKK